MRRDVSCIARSYRYPHDAQQTNRPGGIPVCFCVQGKFNGPRMGGLWPPAQSEALSLRASALTGVAIRVPSLQEKRTDCHTSDIGHWCGNEKRGRQGTPLQRRMTKQTGRNPGLFLHLDRMGEGPQARMTVPVLPSSASEARTREVISASPLGQPRTKSRQDSTLGSMLPGANCPSAI